MVAKKGSWQLARLCCTAWTVDGHVGKLIRFWRPHTSGLGGLWHVHKGCVVAAAQATKVVADGIQVVHRRHILQAHKMKSMKRPNG